MTNIMALVTATLFLRTNLKPDSVAAGNTCEVYLLLPQKRLPDV